MTSLREYKAHPSAQAAWEPAWLHTLTEWFSNASQRGAGITYASGGILERELKGVIRADVDNVAKAYGERITDVVSVAYRVPADTGIPLTCPADQDPKRGHRRRVVALMAVTDALGGDLRLKLRVNDVDRVVAAAPGEVNGMRGVDSYGFTPVLHRDRIVLVSIGIDR